MVINNQIIQNLEYIQEMYVNGKYLEASARFNQINPGNLSPEEQRAYDNLNQIISSMDLVRATQQNLPLKERFINFLFNSNKTDYVVALLAGGTALLFKEPALLTIITAFLVGKIAYHKINKEPLLKSYTNL